MKASSNRIGLHYFPDTQHYREADIQFWLPRLTGLFCLRAGDSRYRPDIIGGCENAMGR